jgi:hypothetical protein
MRKSPGFGEIRQLLMKSGRAHCPRSGGGLVVLVVVALVVAGCAQTHADRTSSGRRVGSGVSHTGMDGASSLGKPLDSSTTTTTPTSPTAGAQEPSPGLPDGPGPQSSYTVQPQPPAGSCHYTFVGSDPLPDPRCTPGALNPDVRQSTIASTICRAGYASSIRPPESVTEPEKRGSANAYGYTGPFSTGEYDHLVPLELGGDPNDPVNLWVEPNDRPTATTTSNSKDALENVLHELVCSGQVALAAAQMAIATNWVNALRLYTGATPTPSPSGSSPAAGAPAPSHGAPTCSASAAPAMNGYRGDYYVTITSNQPGQRATASDAGDTWSDDTDAVGNARILLYHTTPGEQIAVTVGAATCMTTA